MRGRCSRFRAESNDSSKSLRNADGFGLEMKAYTNGENGETNANESASFVFEGS